MAAFTVRNINMRTSTFQSKACLLLTATIFALAAPVDANTHYISGSGTCQLVGDTDLYGIGIRIGLYLQWASILIALVIAPSESIPTFTASNIITFAIIISLLAGISDESLVVADWIIVTCLTFVLFIGLTPGVLINYFDHLRSTMMFGVLCVMYSVILIPLPWVAFVGWSRGQTSSCHFKSWLMLNNESFPGEQGASTLPKSMSIVGGLIGVCMLCSALFFICRRLWLGHGEEGTNPTENLSWERREWSTLRSPIRVSFVTLTALGFGTLAITTVEIAIARNHIDLSIAPLTSTSQLIPFLSGLINLVVICWSAFCGGNEICSPIRQARDLMRALNNKISYEGKSNQMKIVELERGLRQKAIMRMPKIDEENQTAKP